MLLRISLNLKHLNLQIWGRLFHNLGVTPARHWSPLSCHEREATQRFTGPVWDQQLTDIWWSQIMKHLNSDWKDLNYILNLTGSQCTEASTGVLLSFMQQNLKLIVDVLQLLGLNNNKVHYNSEDSRRQNDGWFPQFAGKKLQCALAMFLN